VPHGGAKRAGQLVEMFASAMLHGQPAPEDPNRYPYQLNGLLRRDFLFVLEPEDGVRQIRIQKLRFNIIGGSRDNSRQMELVTQEGDKPQDIYMMLDKFLNQNNLPLSMLHVTNAILALTFTENGPGRTMCIGLSTRSCNLKSKPEEQRLLGERLLRRWNIETVT